MFRWVALVFLRQAGSWNPLQQGCKTCSWTYLSWSYKTQRSYMGLKLAVCMHSWSEFWTKRYKDKKTPNCHFWRARSKETGVLGTKQGTAHVPTAKGWANHLSHPSSPTPRHTPILNPYEEPANPTLTLTLHCPESQQRNKFLVFTPSCSWPRSPNKVLPEFLVWSLVNFYWLEKVKNSGWYHFFYIWQYWHPAAYITSYSVLITQESLEAFSKSFNILQGRNLEWLLDVSDLLRSGLVRAGLHRDPPHRACGIWEVGSTLSPSLLRLLQCGTSALCWGSGWPATHPHSP